MEQSDHWRKPFFTLYFGQAFSILSSGVVQFAIIWRITVKTGSACSLTIADCGIDRERKQQARE